MFIRDIIIELLIIISLFIIKLFVRYSIFKELKVIYCEKHIIIYIICKKITLSRNMIRYKQLQNPL